MCGVTRESESGGGTVLVEMTIKGLMVDPITNMPIIILRDRDGQKVLPIWVGVFEANAIALQIENIQTPRPMTHDLLRNVIQDLQAAVEKIVVCDLKDNTFYALIHLQTAGRPGRHRCAAERRHRAGAPHARADPGGGARHRQRQERRLHQREAGLRSAAAVARVARSRTTWASTRCEGRDSRAEPSNCRPTDRVPLTSHTLSASLQFGGQRRSPVNHLLMSARINSAAAFTPSS